MATITDLIPEAQKHGKAVMQGTWYGIIAATPAGFDKKVYVIIPDISKDHKWGPCNWMAKDNVTLPQIGDQALIIFDNRRAPWVAAFWSGTRHPRVTIGTIYDATPSNPVHGDIWNCLVDGNVGVRWQFMYNANSTSPYKWEFIGGSPYRFAVGGFSTSTVNGWVYGPNQYTTPPHAGDWVAHAVAEVDNGNVAGSMTYLGIQMGGILGGDNGFRHPQWTVQGMSASVYTEAKWTNLPASQGTGLGYYCVTYAASFSDQIMSLQPVRIS